MRNKIEVGFQTFVSDGEHAFGAVREISPEGRPELVIYVENAGEFTVPLTAVRDVHSKKVVLDRDELEPALRRAIEEAHTAEQPPDLD
ncbi:hypothetical protein BH24PSE2_BH24PSE2_17980 [soil metagenome]